MSKERVKLVTTDITEHRCKRSSSTHHRGWQSTRGRVVSCTELFLTVDQLKLIQGSRAGKSNFPKERSSMRNTFCF